MSKRLQLLFDVVLLSLAVCLSAAGRGPSEDDEEAKRLQQTAAARADVLRLADSLDRDEDEIEKQAHALAANHGLKAVMGALKPRDQGGVGVGPTPGAILPDGIELKLLSWNGKKPPARKELETRRDDLVRMAQVLLAVSRVAPNYASRYVTPGDGYGKKQWAANCDDMRSFSQDLIDALKGDDLKAAARAVNSLNSSCNDCHGSHRDP